MPPLPKPGPMRSKFPVVAGIKTFPDGREVCMTMGAWRRRKLEIYQRENGMCQVAPLVGRKRPLIPMYPENKFYGWTGDHIKKRGVDGATRDDRKENLRLTCDSCHDLAHELGIHGTQGEQKDGTDTGSIADPQDRD